MDCSFPCNGRNCAWKRGNEQRVVNCNGRNHSRHHNRYVFVYGSPGAFRDRIGLSLEPRRCPLLNFWCSAGHIYFYQPHDCQCVVGPYREGSRQEPSWKSRQFAHLPDWVDLFNWNGYASFWVSKPNCVSATPFG